MSEVTGSIPFHLARAYAGAQPALSAGRRVVVPSAAGGGASAMREAPARMPSAAMSRLVAARVAGGIDFGDSSTGSGAIPTVARQTNATTLAFYTNPTERNAAATAVTASLSAGRVLDTTV